jgi:hypothetical protein
MARTAPRTSMVGLLAAVVLVAAGCAAESSEGTGASAKSATSGNVAVGDKPSTSSDPALVATSSPTSSPTPDPLPSIPKVRGMSQADAEQALIAAGFVVGEISEVPSARSAGTVLHQSIEVGTLITAGTVVGLTLAVPYPSVTSVIGLSRRAATNALQGAGFNVEVVEETRSSGRDGVVLSQTPAGNELAKPGAVITLVVSHLVRPVTPPVSHSCTPGYKPCLAPASDYDCAGGSGNGPAYANGPVYVTGSDPYDLDANGDGVACE